MEQKTKTYATQLNQYVSQSSNRPLSSSMLTHNNPPHPGDSLTTSTTNTSCVPQNFKQ